MNTNFKQSSANELADEFKNRDWDEVDCVLWCEKSANMLRQQADRIGVLEANHEIQKNINDKALQYIEQLEQGLRASIDLNNAQATRTTPQTKPLSDEEIIELFENPDDFSCIEFARAILRKAQNG